MPSISGFSISEASATVGSRGPHRARFFLVARDRVAYQGPDPFGAEKAIKNRRL